MPDPFDVPKWVKKFVTDWKSKLSLWGWRLHFRMSNSPHDIKAHGAVIVHSWTNEAEIELRVGIQDDLSGHKTIVHELLHVLHGRIDVVVRDVIIDALPEQLKEMAESAYDNVNEPFIDNLADCLLEIEREAFKAGMKKGKKQARKA
jgi:hypothetical protein